MFDRLKAKFLHPRPTSKPTFSSDVLLESLKFLKRYELDSCQMVSTSWNELISDRANLLALRSVELEFAWQTKCTDLQNVSSVQKSVRARLGAAMEHTYLRALKVDLLSIGVSKMQDYVRNYQVCFRINLFL